MCHANGWGVPENKQVAIELYKKAAGLGSSLGMKHLGLAYLYGNGVAKDEAAGLDWLKRAADTGFGDAMNDLADFHHYWQTPTKDMTEAVRWYRQAAERGHAGSMWRLGEMLTGEETGVPHEPAEGNIGWRRRVEKTPGREGPTPDQELIAKNELRQAAQRPWPNRPTPRALKILERAAKLYDELNRQKPETVLHGERQDRTNCYYESGRILAAEGRGDEAASMFRKAIDMVTPEMTKASLDLAELYESGNGVPQDKTKGQELRNKLNSQHIKKFTIACEAGKDKPKVNVFFYAFERSPMEASVRDSGTVLPRSWPYGAPGRHGLVRAGPTRSLRRTTSRSPNSASMHRR